MKEKVKKHAYKIIIFFLVLIIVASTMYIFDSLAIEKEVTEEREALNETKINEEQIDAEEASNGKEELAETNEIENENTNGEDNIENGEDTNNGTERMMQVRALQEDNSDIVGWLEIPNTIISYPVVQGEDNKYYINHNYKKEKSKKGAIFLDKDYNWDLPSSNLLIYGHNIRDGDMFQELLKYTDEQFYKKHPTIRFTTGKEDAEYEIISVFKSKVYYKNEENVFRYYYFINAETEKEYMDFIENAKKASLYEIDASAEYGDQLITLSTCSYHTKDGRFAVVGKKK